MKNIKIIRKNLITVFALCNTLILAGCGNSSAAGFSSGESSVAAENAGNATGAGETSGAGNLNEDQEEIPDYYIEDGVLYISKIHYSVMFLVGKNQYIYETPWESKRDDFSSISVNATLVCDKDEGRTGKEYINHSGIFQDLDNITDAEVTLDMQGVRDASFLLSDCDNLTSADVVIEAAPIDSAAYLFSEDKNLKNAKVWFSNDQPENVKRMFYECSAMTSGSTNVSKKVTDCTEMYFGCSSIRGADILFSIDDDTQFGMMFGDCAGLSGVSIPNVRVTKGGQGMFNNVNSIGSYAFADSWSVDTENLADPLGDSFHDVLIVPLGKSDMMLEFNIYSKSRPSWYKSFIENVHDLDDWYCISESRIMDVYVNMPEDYDDISTADVMDAVDDALAELATRDSDGAFTEAAKEIKNTKDTASDITDTVNELAKLTVR